MKKKLLLLLSVALLFAGIILVATPMVKANEDDWSSCPFCDHRHGGDNRCETCGGCTDACDIDCFFDHHCDRCYECADNERCRDVAGDCGLCMNCVQDCDWHCKECLLCYATAEEYLCGDCGKCGTCSGGYVCEDCGFCTECAEKDNIHCEKCDSCLSVTGECVAGYEGHCENDCIVCENCGDCFFERDDLMCFECGELCIECCNERSQDEGCITGEVCMESSEWNDHFCENCGEDIYYNCGGKDVCEYCGLCLECCADESDCVEGMCVENPNYENHFCEDCGQCFCVNEKCDTCENICEECCKTMAEEYIRNAGCTHYTTTPCVSDSEFINHIGTEHPGTSHAHKYGNNWEMTETQHYKKCVYCDNETDRGNHNFVMKNSLKQCEVCGYIDGAKIYITKQPRDCNAKVSTIYGESYAIFNVSAKAKSGSVKYQWYLKETGSTDEMLADGEGVIGATTSTLKVRIPDDACPGTGNYGDRSYYCVVKDKDGNTITTNEAKLKISHAFYEVKDEITFNPEFVKNYKYIPNGSEEVKDITFTSSNGHTWKCAAGCGTLKSEKYSTPHDFTTRVKIGTLAENADGTTGNVYMRECKECGFKEYSYSHVHKYYFEDGRANCSLSYVFENGTITTEELVKGAGYTKHPLKCIQENCDEYIMVPHRWGSWVITGYPSKTSAAGMARECLDCSYTENCFKDNKGNNYQWTINNALVETENVLADKFLVEPGDNVKLTLNLKTGDALKSWKVETVIRQDGTTKDVTNKFTITKNGDKYETVIPTWSELGRTSGGIIIRFTAITGLCEDHSETELINVKAQICLKEGYTGDYACVKCGKVITEGDIIEVPDDAEHEDLHLIPGTENTTFITCTRAYYEGDFKCETCGAVVSGKKGEKGAHHYPLTMINVKKATCYEEGWKGDFLCTVCHKIVKSYGADPILHKQEGNYEIVGKKEATCSEAGYTGNKKCNVADGCGEIFEYGVTIPAKGHDWGDWVVEQAPTSTQAGKRNRTCKTCGTKEEKLFIENEFVITFEPGEGATVDPDKAITLKTRKLTSIPVPKRDGYIFANWVMGTEEDIETVTLDTQFTKNTTVRAVYEDETLYKITYKSNVPSDDGAGGIGDTIVYTNKEGKLNSLIERQLSPGKKYKFVGWYFKDGTDGDYGEEVTTDYIFTRESFVYGKWEAASASEYTITFKSDEPAKESKDVTYNKKITIFPNWTNAGHELVRWYMEDGKEKITVTKNTIFTKDTTVYAEWELADAYKITFNANGGTITTKEAYASKTDGKLQLTELPTPTYAGYEFNGWFRNNNEEVTVDTVFEEDTIVYAKWTYIGGYKVTFNPNGGTVSITFARTDANTNKLLIDLPVPTKNNYDFAGWFTEDGTRITSKSVFKADTEIIAKWIYNAGYIITFNPNGGTVSKTSEMANEEGKLTSLPTPTKSGYKFDGWYDALNGGNKIDVNKVYTADTEIFAHWTQKTTGGGGTGTSSVKTYKITTKTDANAVITPNGVVEVEKGDDQTFRIKAKDGYEIEDVLVDGESIGVISAYTFENVKAKHTIEVKTKKKAAEEETETSYSDITATSWYQKSVTYVTKKKLMNGTGDNKFSPEAYMTRGMIVTVLYRLDATGEIVESSFTDVDVNAYYAKAVAWAEKYNIVNGYGDGKFGPNDIITREQLATILYRYANYKKYDVSIGEDTNILSYNDISDLAEYAIPAMQWACGEELIKGMDNNMLSPKGNATRAQVATILMRFCERYVK